MIHIVRKSLPRFPRFLSLVLIRLVFTEIQPFENVKIYKEMYGNPDAVRLCTIAVMSHVADMSSDVMWNTQPIISCILSNNTQLKTDN